MTSQPYAVQFTPAARRRMAKLPLSAASALYEHIMGPIAENPYRLGKPLEDRSTTCGALVAVITALSAPWTTTSGPSRP